MPLFYYLLYTTNAFIKFTMATVQCIIKFHLFLHFPSGHGLISFFIYSMVDVAYLELAIIKPLKGIPMMGSIHEYVPTCLYV